MSKVGKILRRTFLYIIPIALFVNIAIHFDWKVTYEYEGKNHTTIVSGFPFPSDGNFTPPLWYNSGESSTDALRYWINGVIKILIAVCIFLILKFTIKNIKPNWFPLVYVLIGVVYGVCGLFTFFLNVILSGNFSHPFPASWTSELSHVSFFFFP